jgi:hypothetical protein
MVFKIRVYGGDEGDRTPDLSVANAALSHLSYIPIPLIMSKKIPQVLKSIPCYFFQTHLNKDP